MVDSGCFRCGRQNMLQVTHPAPDVEVRLCVWCRRQGEAETQAAKKRSRGDDPTTDA